MRKFFEIISLKTVAVTLAVLLSISYASNNAYAYDPLACSPERSGVKSGKGVDLYQTKCPNGKERRNDIDVNCVAKQTEGHCIDIMPVQNKNAIDRIPEDVCQRNEGWGKPRNHNGMDYSLGHGQAITAAADGKVQFAGHNCSPSSEGAGNGNYVVLVHNPGSETNAKGEIVPSPHTGCFKTKYLHMTSIAVSTGQQVKKGQVIGKVGGTGCRKSSPAEGVYGVHLHFEITTCTDQTLDPFCPDIMALCGEKNTTEEGQYSTLGLDNRYGSKIGGANQQQSFDPNVCRDCNKNPVQCGGAYVNADINVTGKPIGDSVNTFGSMGAQTAVYGATDCSITHYRSQFEQCVFCDLFETLFNAASRAARYAFGAITDASILVLLIGTAIWLSLTVLRYISSFEEKEPRAMLKEILGKLFLVISVIYILYIGPEEFIKLVIAPIFNTGLTIAVMTRDQTEVICREAGTIIGFEQGGSIPAEMGNGILCVIKSIQDGILSVLSLGSTSICIAFNGNQRNWIFPHFGYLFTGLGLWGASVLLMIMYPWVLIDSVLKMAISFSLLPAAIAAYPYKFTRRYSSIVWKDMLNAMFNFLFLTLIIFIIIKIINISLEGVISYEIANNLNDSGWEQILNNLGWWSLMFLKILFVIFLGFAMLGEGPALANEFSSGLKMSENIGRNVGGLAASSGVAASRLGLRGVGKGATSIGGMAGKEIKSSMNNFNLARNSNAMERRLNSGKATRDENGNIVDTRKDWRGRKRTRTLEKGENGNIAITNSRTTAKGNTVSMKTDKYLSVKTQTDAKGNIVGQKIEVKAASAKNLVNSKGELNKNAASLLMNNSMHDAQTLQIAMMDELTKKRMNDRMALKESFASREVKTFVDDKGNKVTEITQINKDGTLQRNRIVFTGKTARVDAEYVGNGGNAVKMSSDGIINKRETLRYDKDGNAGKSTTSYAFSSKYRDNRTSAAMDTNGEYANWVPEDEIMYDEKEIEDLKEQIKKYGRTGALNGFNL